MTGAGAVEKQWLSKPTRKTVTVDEAAVILGVGRGAAYRATRNGDIPTIRIGHRVLVPLQALERMLAGEG